MKEGSCAASAVAPHLEGRSAASHSWLGMIPWVLVLLTAFAGLYAVSMGVSRVLVQSLGVGVLLALGVPLTVGVLRRPETLARWEDVPAVPADAAVVVRAAVLTVGGVPGVGNVDRRPGAVGERGRLRASDVGRGH